MRLYVDAICIDEDNNIVLVERLNNPTGLAFPGGGIEEGEDRGSAIVREVSEETGLMFTLSYWLNKVYDKPGRDPRGPSTSRVAVGHVKGVVKNEEGKTRVVVLSSGELAEGERKMAFDHHDIFLDFLKGVHRRSI